MIHQTEAPKKGDTVATIHTSLGDIKVRLFPEAAPETVKNFVTHAENDYYNGIIFHRVIKDFMIQGGDPTGTGMGGESIFGHPFKDEFSEDLHNIYGALSMANAGPGTNGSQFFIVQKSDIEPMFLEQMEQLSEQGFGGDTIENYRNLGGTPWLDFKHSVFGQVYEGMDTVEKIAAVEVDGRDKPLEDVTIESIDVETL